MLAIEVLDDGNLREIGQGTGCRVGGQDVNNAFFQSCKDVIQGPAWQHIGSENADELLAMEKEFEDRKVQIGAGDAHDEQINVLIPPRIRKLLEKGEVSIKPGMERSKYFRIEKEKLMYDSCLVRVVLFNETVELILNTIADILSRKYIKEIKTMVLVGGFAESHIVVGKIRELLSKKHPDVKVVVPTSPFRAVLKGAVLYGHDPLIFLSRVSRATFGIRSNRTFDPNKHDPAKKWTNQEDGKVYCKDIFSVHVRTNQALKLKEKQPFMIYKPIYKDQKGMGIEIFSSQDQDPMYTTDEGCKQIGSIEVKMPDTTGGTNRKIKVEMIYGGTELSVIATDEITGNEFPADIRFDSL